MPLIDLPVPQIGVAGFDRAALKWAKALRKALNWSVPKGGLLKLRDTPDGFALDLDPPRVGVPAVLTGTLAKGGTRASPTSAQATVDLWNGSAFVAAVETITVFNKYTLPADLPSGSAVDVYRYMGGYFLLTATPC